MKKKKQKTHKATETREEKQNAAHHTEEEKKTPNQVERKRVSKKFVVETVARAKQNQLNVDECYAIEYLAIYKDKRALNFRFSCIFVWRSAFISEPKTCHRHELVYVTWFRHSICVAFHLQIDFSPFFTS